MFPEPLQIGQFTVYSDGVLLFPGFLAAIWWPAHLAKKEGIPPMKTEALGLVIVLTAGIGLKLLTALDYPGFYSRKAFAGEVILIYALNYAVVRFFLEFFRGDPRGYYFNHLLSTSQLISLLIIPAAAFLLGRLRKQAALAKQHQYKTQRVLVLSKTRARSI